MFQLIKLLASYNFIIDYNYILTTDKLLQAHLKSHFML